MSLKEQITEDMKAAMRAKEADRLLTIRGLMAAMKQKEVDERITLDDAAIVGIVDKLIKQRKDSISQWVLQLRERVGWQKACVALANKNARILWAMMTREQPYDPNHAPAMPCAKTPGAAANRAAVAIAS